MENTTSIQELMNSEINNKNNIENTTSIKELMQSEINNKPGELISQNNKMEIINQDKDYNSYIIKPPPSRDIFKNKLKYFFVDSRDRNTNIFPSASKFEIATKEDYRYIKSLNLVSAQIPDSQYLININNNKLNYYIGNTKKDKQLEEEIEVETGIYTDPNPINNLLPNSIPKLKESESSILDRIYFQDLLSIEIEKKLRNKINDNNCNQNNPYIEWGYNFVKDNYFLLSDLCPRNQEIYKGEKMNLCFKGNTEPYGPQEIEKIPKRNIYEKIERDSEGNVIFEEIKIGDKVDIYKKKTIGKVIGFGIDNYNGFVINGINNLKNPLIFNLNVLKIDNNDFTNKLTENIYIIIEQYINDIYYCQRFRIKKIINGNCFEIYDPNNTETGANAPLTPPGNPEIEGGIFPFDNGSLFAGYILSPNRKNFTLERYVILKIRHAHKIDSQNDSAQNSYMVIPFNTMVLDVDARDYNSALWSRNFNPPLASLTELSFEFLNYDGSPYNFEGYEVNLLFIIETLNQSSKYG